MRSCGRSWRRFCLPAMLLLLLLLVVVVATDDHDPGENTESIECTAELDSDLRQIIDNIVLTTRPIENGSWEQNTLQLLSQLRSLVNSRGKQGAILQYLLTPGRTGFLLVHNKQRLHLALKYWIMNPHELVGRGDLFLHLIAQTVAHSVPRRFELLEAVARSLASEALAVTDSDGRTPFELYLQLLCADPELDTEVAVVLAERSPDVVAERCRLATVSDLPAHVWTRVFHRRNQSAGDLDDVLRRSRDAGRLLTEIALSRLRYADLDAVGDELRTIFPASDPSRFLSSCRGIFDYYMEERDLLAVWHLSTYFKQTHRELFLQTLPYMFATLSASYHCIVFLTKKLLFCRTIPEWHMRVLDRLLSFHLSRHGPIGIWLADQFEDAFRIDLLRLLLRDKFRSRDLATDRDVLRAGLQAGVGLVPARDDDDREPSPGRKLSLQMLINWQGDPVERPRDDATTGVLDALTLGLTLRTLLETRALDQFVSADFLQRLPRVGDDRLRLAFMIAASAADFAVDAAEIQVAHPALFQRMAAVLPLKMRPPATAAAASVASPITFRTGPLPPLRACDNVDDEYEIVNVLGEGMYATVFVGHPVGSAHTVAIKVQRSDSPLCVAETDFMRRFCSGYFPVPGLVRLLDAFQYGPDTYLVMPKVNGTPLASWTIPDDPIAAVRRLLVVVFQILVVLERLHQIGLEHGDLQHLNNFLVSQKTGALTLIDFGLSGRRGRQNIPCDHAQLYIRLTELLDNVRRRLNLCWWDPSPAALAGLEAAITDWPYRNWSLAGLIADPIFDDVRQLGDLQRCTSSLNSPVPAVITAPGRRSKWVSRVIRFCQRRS